MRLQGGILGPPACTSRSGDSRRGGPPARPLTTARSRPQYPYLHTPLKCVRVSMSQLVERASERENEERASLRMDSGSQSSRASSTVPTAIHAGRAERIRHALKRVFNTWQCSQTLSCVYVVVLDPCRPVACPCLPPSLAVNSSHRAERTFGSTRVRRSRRCYGLRKTPAAHACAGGRRGEALPEIGKWALERCAREGDHIPCDRDVLEQRGRASYTATAPFKHHRQAHDGAHHRHHHRYQHQPIFRRNFRTAVPIGLQR